MSRSRVEAPQRGEEQREGGGRRGAAADALSRIGDATLAAAARAIRARWRESMDPAVDPNPLVERLAVVAARVEQGLDSAGANGDSARDPALDRRLLDLLQTEVIGIWSRKRAAPDPRGMLALLRAFESARGTRDAEQFTDLSRMLSGPRGLDLTVEFAHDLRSPLTSILFLAETLIPEHAAPEQARQRQQLQVIYSAGLIVLSMASDIIELARGGDRLAEAKSTPFSLAGVLDSVLEMVRPMAEEKGLEVRFASCDPDRRLGYAVALSRVLLNLTTNALRYTEQGHVDITARALDARRVEFVVRDTGPGMDANALATLFEPFPAAPELAKQLFSGSGLGLAICRKLVRAMGSELAVESGPGQGTRFSFTLELPPERSN